MCDADFDRTDSAQAVKHCSQKVITIVTIAFSAFMVIGRLISGVHWLTDIVGGVLLSIGLFSIYQGAVILSIKNK